MKASTWPLQQSRVQAPSKTDTATGVHAERISTAPTAHKGSFTAIVPLRCGGLQYPRYQSRMKAAN